MIAGSFSILGVII